MCQLLKMSGETGARPPLGRVTRTAAMARPEMAPAGNNVGSAISGFGSGVDPRWRKIRQADLGAGLLLRRLYLFRFSLLASSFVFTHTSSVPRVAEFTPNDFKSARESAARYSPSRHRCNLNPVLRLDKRLHG